MKRRLPILLLLMSAAIAAEPAPPSTPAKLRWRNGETIPGELVEASAADMTWKTPLFEDSLLLGWPALRRVDRPLAAIATTDPFSITFRDGSHIHGDLVSVTEQSVTIKSARHGDAVLKRSEVLSVRRLKGGNLMFAGPDGDVSWDTLANRKKPTEAKKPSAAPPAIPPLTTGPAGALSMPYWNRGAFLDLTLPELLDVEFRVHSSARPDFQLSLEGAPKQRVRVETWDDELVLATADQFKFIRKIGNDERDLSLRICWDRKTAKCLVFTPAGELIAEWQVPEDPGSSNSGLVLQSKGRDLSLEFLRVRVWDGKPPPRIDGQQPRIELADGRIVAGKVTGGSADSITLQSRETASGASYPLDEVAAVIFSTDSPKVSEQEATLSYADGTILKGRIASIKDGRAMVEVSFTDEPFATRLEALRQLLLKVPAPDGTPPERPFAELDKLSVQQTSLHGKLVSAGDAWPRWLPVGGLKPVMPAKAMTNEITRALPHDAALATAPALFYTSTGDVLSGNLRALDASGVEFDSSFVETTKLPSNNLEAIQFGASAQMSVEGFGDPAWRIVKGDKTTIRKTNDSLGMEPGTVICHPTIMQCSEIKFSLSYNGLSTVRLRLFCAGTDGTRSLNVMLAHMGSRVYSGLESSDNDVDDRADTSVPSGRPLEVRLVIQDKQVELHLNGVFTQKFAIDPARRAGAGLIIEPASLFGNMVTAVSLTKFSASSAPGRTSVPEVGAESKLQALTVPRFRKDDPPRHALLAANGDVLRGEIEAVTATHFGFRSGLENLRVPRERVKAAIWLKKPLEDAAPPVEKSPVLKGLEQKITRRIRYASASLSILIGVLQRETDALKFKLPENQDSRRFDMQFGGQTIAEALDKICSLFGLRYRLDSAGMIVLEAAPNVPKDLVQKVYWLKSDAFPATASAQELLAAKGIAFPAGASALWQPNAGQLSMTNTLASHRQLAPLLEADFGGSLGSPTHWLLLTSGARLGLAVDKFEEDAISGHHPSYGQCKVPMPNVYIIRTFMPEPTAAMKSLEDWHLVFAREPVLPETGGESSPNLGKEAKTFKLPLLGGGDFDLGREKGNVIVLDFWATWCGPCIKSLPGLIEAMSAFPADRVKLIGVNQSEPAEQVKRFLETRGWKLTVAMDAGQGVARQYGVDGIPHTVIVGPDGKVAWVKTGYSPDGEAEAAKVVKQLLSAGK